MKKQLIEITKGSAKGLIGTICSSTIIGLPAADGIYNSINSREGKIAYGIVGGVLLASTFGILYFIGD